MDNADNTIRSMVSACKREDAGRCQFNAVQQYILDGKPIEGVIRFFAGYAGWDHGQLAKEIKENSWLIGKAGKETLLNQHFRDLWHTSLNEMGGKYAIWARYPQYPSLN